MAAPVEIRLADEEASKQALPHRDLAVNEMALGQFAKALPEQQEALRLEPYNGTNYVDLANVYMSLGRLDDARAMIQQGFDHGLDGVGLRADLYAFGFFRGNAAEMEKQVAWSAGKAGSRRRDALASV